MLGVFHCIYCSIYTLDIGVFICYNGIIENIRKKFDIVPIKYKINILAALKAAGYSTYKLRQQKIFGERTIQKFRDGEIVTADNLAVICKLLNCQPGDILEYEEENT